MTPQGILHAISFTGILLSSIIQAAGVERPLADATAIPQARIKAVLPSDIFYDPAHVQSIELEIKPEDLQRMQKALPERITVPGTFRWKDQTIRNVGIRYKGNSSSIPNAQHKRSFLITFTEYVNGQRFLGLRHVALDNGVQFGSLFSEPLITMALRESGVKASRCNYSALVLNGRSMGVYVNVERLDESFLEQQFGNSTGILFKVDEGGPGADLNFMGADPGLYKKAFELKEGKKKESYPKLVDLIRAFSNPTLTEEQLRTRFDLDSFLASTAVLLFSGAFDQYTGWNPHNYYLYQNPSDQRWSYLPWDLDVGFADQAFGRIPVLQGWNAAWPAPAPGRPLMEHVISNENILKQYRKVAAVILEKHFHPDILIPKLRKLHDQIKNELAKDPFPPRRVTVPSDRSYQDILGSMESFIKERYTLARSQLDHTGQRPAFHPLDTAPRSEGGEPRPGPASPDAPKHLTAVQVTSSFVELKWADHAEGEVAYIVQRAEEREENDFVNAIGQGGENVVSAVDNKIEPGKTYRYRVYAVLPTPEGPRGTGVSNTILVEIPKNK
ncbi:MAG: CotH kinase family protein [Verrucomicrobiales bacterium]